MANLGHFLCDNIKIIDREMFEPYESYLFSSAALARFDDP